MKNKILIPTVLFIVVFVFSITMLAKNRDTTKNPLTTNSELINAPLASSMNEVSNTVLTSGETTNNPVANIKETVNNLASANSTPNNQEIILFSGDGCPYCLIVEEYLHENNASERISYTIKEVYYNKQNANELGEKARACGMSTNSIGVPFLWDGVSCYVGGPDIMGFFQGKLNI